MGQMRLHKHSQSKKEQAVLGVVSRASVHDPIDEFQGVYGSRAASVAFGQQLGSDFSSSHQIQPPIQAKPSFRGLSQELAAESQPVQLKEEENKTGLPDDLKAGVEALSGYSLDDVRVHYNSSKPAQLQALAYTQGTEIHVGSGQEKHLAHEAWHVVQQMKGKVKPTVHMKGVHINDDRDLELEADKKGKSSILIGVKQRQTKYLKNYISNIGTLSSEVEIPPMLPENRQQIYTYSTQKPKKPENKAFVNKETIQLLTAPLPVPQHNNIGMAIFPFTNYETVTNQAGFPSNTANFIHFDGSERLERFNININGIIVGEIWTVGPFNQTVVKMHLVNSWLHPQANNWRWNWVWGSATLNFAHAIVEAMAKRDHPSPQINQLGPTQNTSLNYETAVMSRSNTDNQNAQQIALNIAQSIYQSYNFALPPNMGQYLQNLASLIRIDGQQFGVNLDTLENHVARWKYAVRRTSAREIETSWRTEISNSQQWQPQITRYVIPDPVPDPYRLRFNIRIWGLYDLFTRNPLLVPPPPPREKKRIINYAENLTISGQQNKKVRGDPQPRVQESILIGT